MPTIEVDYDDLQALIGKHVPLDELRDKAIQYAKGEVEDMDGETLKLDVKDANRPELWSAEGIAREIAGRYGRPGLPAYKVKKPKLTVKVDAKVKHVRPYTVCAVVRGLKIDNNVLSQMIQLQEKVAETFGKRRREVAIGVYDFHKIKGPIRYTTVKPDGIRFVPLEFSNPLTPKQILEQHPKGKEYRHLLDGQAEYPIFIDNAGEVLSMPPIINSNHTGKVTSETRDVFIECSGFNLKWNMDALNVLVTALADRGADIEGVKVVYPKGHVSKTIITPSIKPKSFSINVKDANDIIGITLSAKQMVGLLEKARYSAKVSGNSIEVQYPAYRQDIMHWRDIAEDIAISYGYDNIEPVPPQLATTGKELDSEKSARKATELMVGLGLQEVMSYMLTNKDNIFNKMNMKETPCVEIENVISANWSVFRTWLLPSLMEFLSKNKHAEYPQRVFETGMTVMTDQSKETRTKDVRKLACALSSTVIGYEDASSLLDAFLTSLGIKYKLRPGSHSSFITGRNASIHASGKDIGVIGEVHPKVLNSWNLEKPVVAFELNLDDIFSILNKG
jgi:phenylalanyl-tRNA synthetase beta chain